MCLSISKVSGWPDSDLSFSAVEPLCQIAIIYDMNACYHTNLIPRI